MKSVTSLLLIGILAFLLASCNDTGNINDPNKEITTGQLGNTWTVPGDFATIQEAINSPDVLSGDIINVGPGEFAGAEVTKGVHIIGIDEAIINSGPLHTNGMIIGFRFTGSSSNASIENFKFVSTDLSIMNGRRDMNTFANNVEVAHCTFINSIQAITNWRGNGWNIHHNKITDLRTRNGGGIGILLGDYKGGVVNDNVVSHNDITGTLHVSTLPNEGGYAGTGIVIYADFRYNAAGALEVKGNFVTHNKVSLISDNPSLVDVWAFELTDTWTGAAHSVIFDNYIGFNDFRGTENNISLSPESLDNPVNTISRNLGDNRGHGQHPGDFKP